MHLSVLMEHPSPVAVAIVGEHTIQVAQHAALGESPNSAQ